MNKLSPTQALGWLIGFLLLFSWNLQAEVNPGRIAPHYLVQSNNSFKLLTPADELPPLSGTATVGEPFSFNLPFLIPLQGTTTVTVTGLPANGLSVQLGSGVSVIKGTPLTSGVMNLTLVNSQMPSGITAFRAITLTVNDPLPPLSGTATVGEPFSFNLPFLIPLQGTTTVNVTGLPANGLSVKQGSGFGSIIGGTPLTSGVMNLTLVNSQTPSGITAFRAITLTVNDPLPPLSGTATVGEPFSFNLPFLIPLQGTTTVNVTGLPANGLSVKQGSGFGSIIGGTPLTSGVMNLTLVNSQTPSGITAFRAITLTVNDPLPPLSGTATVGEPFSFNLPFLIPLQGTTTVNVTGLPANGLSVQLGSGVSVIKGTPLTSGVMNLTLVNSQMPSGITAFRAITLTVNPAPGTPPTNHPPVAPSIASQTATVGVAYFQNTPSFTDPDGQAIAVQAFGLPPGLTYTGTASGIVAGTPTTAGVYSVSLVGTDLGNGIIAGGLSATAVYTITVSPASPGGGTLILLAPTYNCTTGAFTFNTSGGDGSPITFAAIGITGPTTNPNQFVDTELRTAADAPLITLSASQNGSLVTYVWNIRAVCPVGPGTPPVTPPGSGLSLLAPTYNCATGAFTFNTSGGDGSAITFSAIGITGPTTNPNQFVDTELRTAADAPLITLSATQNGTTVTYVWNIRAQCPVGPGTPPVNPPVGSALTLLAPTYNCATGAFTFNTSGGNGTPIEYRAVPGITDWTTNPNQFVDEGSRTANDVQPFLLEARQNGVVVTFVWNLKAACGRARLGAGEPERRLRVVVLGNPVVGETVQVEVSGAEGQPLRVILTNLQGLMMSEERIGQAAATEQVGVKLGRSGGVYLLQVNSLSQTKVVRVLKTE